MSERSWLDIDFKEIPQANISNGNQDAFELFARDLFEALGFKIIKFPARGSDDRKDLIISEKRQGVLGTIEIKHLVSCKHYAHNAQPNKSVGNNEEPDLIGRLKNNGCTGFIGFYSTIPSEGLQRDLTLAKENNLDFMEYTIFDKAKIVKALHSNKETLSLYKRYFPHSFRQKYSSEIDSQLYSKKPIIRCCQCDSNIIEDMNGKIIKLYENTPIMRYGELDWDKPLRLISNIIFSCNDCEGNVLKNLPPQQSIWPKSTDSNPILNYTSPKYFIDNLMLEVSRSRAHPNIYSDNAYRIWNNFNRSMFYFVARHQEHINKNTNLPSFDFYEL